MLASVLNISTEEKKLQQSEKFAGLGHSIYNRTGTTAGSSVTADRPTPAPHTAMLKMMLPWNFLPQGSQPSHHPKPNPAFIVDRNYKPSWQNLTDSSFNFQIIKTSI